MATLNPFDLLGDDDAVDPAVLLAIAEKKAAAAAPVQTTPVQDPAQGKKGPVQGAGKPTSAKGNNKNQPPATQGGEPRNEGQRGDRGDRGGRGGFRSDRGGRGYNREPRDNENTVGNRNEFSGGYNRPSEDGGERAPSERRPFNGPRGGGGGFRGGRRGGFSNGDAEEGGERPRRVYDRRSGTGRGNPNEFKREGAGRANWGTPTDELAAPETEEPVNEGEKIVDSEKQADEAGDANKESPVKEQDEKEPEPEEKEMTLEEYEKILEDKRKALLALKSEERKVDVDKELKSMQLLSNKKNNDEVFAKLGVDKDKKKEAAEKAKKSVSINEFLKPAEGENYRLGGRGRGRGRGARGGYNEGNNKAQAPAIQDDRQFPSLGGK